MAGPGQIPTTLDAGGNPGPAAKLSFTVQPSNVVAGAPIAPAVRVAIEDANSNIVTTSTAAITLALRSGTGTTGAHLRGTLTVNAVNGVATFSTLSVDSVGTSYRVNATTSGLPTATSYIFNVAVAPASRVGFTVQPSNVSSSTPISPAVKVAIEDSLGNLVSSSVANVSVGIAAGTGTAGARLGGATTVSVVGGVATFGTLTVDLAGVGYQLSAASTGLVSATSAAFTVTVTGRTYATSFPLTENPISEGGNWINGGTVGLDWSNVATTPGLAIGRQTSGSYNDATAILTGPWGANQRATGTVYSVSQNDACDQEIELRLRSAISAHVNTGYEITYKASQTSGAYLIVVRWNGALGNFTMLLNRSGSQYGVKTGDVVSASIVGSVITAYKNGVAMGSVTDGTWSGGAPGIGFAQNNGAGCSGTNGNFGYSSYTAQDSGGGAPPPPPPSRLAFMVQPSSGVAGAPLAPAVQVAVQDSLGNVVTGSTASVTVALAGGTSGARLRGTTTVNAVNGLATFAGLSVDSVGSGYTLTASASGLSSAGSTAFAVVPAPAARLAFTIQPKNVAAGAALTPAVLVAVEDSIGNVVTSSTAGVTVALTSGTGTAGARLRGTTSVSAVGGVATFAGLSVDSVGTGYSLTATASGLVNATSGAFNVTTSSGARLVFTVQPTSAVAGTALAPAVQVSVQDSVGNLVTGSTASVTVALAGGTPGARLRGTATISAVGGVATFAGLSVDSVGSGYTLVASSSGLTGTASTAFAVTPAPAVRLSFAVQPASAIAGAPIVPAVQVAVRDSIGNLVTSSTASVTLALTGGTAGARLRGTATVNAVAGVASFGTLSVDSVGSGYTLTSSAGGLAGATSAAFSVASAPASRLMFAVQPAGGVAGSAITPAVQVSVRDSIGNLVAGSTASVTVALAGGTGTAGAHLRGTATVNAVAGVASFGTLSVDSVGSGYTLSASASGLSGATSSAFAVASAPATRLGFTVQPANAVAGAPIAPAVRAAIEDSLGNAVTSSTATVTVAITSGTGKTGARLRGTTAMSAVNGVASFSTLSVDSAGSGYKLSATASGVSGATSAAFNVAVAPPSRLIYLVQPTNIVSGAVMSPAVQVAIRDSVGNLVTTSTASVTLAITTGTGKSGARLGGTTTVSAVSGVASFGTLTVDSAATGYTLTASASGLTGATSGAFSVTAASGRMYTTSFPLTENPISEGGNWINGGTVGLDWSNVSTTPGLAIGRQTSGSYNDATAILTGSWGPNQRATGTVYSVNQNDACDQEIELRLRSAISAHNNRGYEITYKASQTSGAYLIIVRWNGTLGNFTMLFNQSGSKFGIKTGDVLSASMVGNVITAYKNGVAMGSVTDGTWSNGAPGIGFAQNNGSGCSGTNGNFGYSSYTAQDSGSGSPPPPPPSRLAFTTQPSNGVAGAALAPAVQVAVRDSLGNLVTSSTASVTVALAGGTAGARLRGTTTVNAVSGVAMFAGLSVDSVGSGYTLAASSSGLTGATSGSFSISSAPASKLTFAVQPAGAAAGAVIVPAVQVVVRDSIGNLVSSSTTSVTVALAGGTAGASLRGTTTVSAVNGVATFGTLSVDSAGSGYTLTAGATGLTGATSTAFGIAGAPASNLTFSVQPAGGVAGTVMSPAVQVAIRDSVGNLVTGSAASVTVAITGGTGTAGAKLGGTTTVSAVNGVATFATLTVDSAGTGYTLTASATGLTSATSATFAVTPTTARTYSTAFPLTENPISEGGNWINGGTTGLDWSDVSTTPGLAIGHETGASYTDATAILTGPWGANQQATGTVYSVNPNDACYQEVELRLRSAIAADRNTGYEVSFKVSQSSAAYLIIVRWNGALGNFTTLLTLNGAQYGVTAGDVVSATVVGNVITAYKNGVAMGQATDNTFAAGAPGIGFNLENAPAGCSGTNGNYGYTAFAATDAPAP